MNKISISCKVNDLTEKIDTAIFAFANVEIASHVNYFHNSLPNYKPTPLVELSSLASYLGINRLYIKDESYRFDLNAFKILGASFAIAKYLGEFIGLEDNELLYSKIIALKSKYEHITFVTATDGNHGRAVAWAAKLFGCQSVVYMPKGSSITRLEAIKSFGAEASITELNYDDTVIHANQKSQENDWILLQDTSWEGYEQIPIHIMQGYCTLVSEFIDQQQGTWPTHVFVQAGVGSLAAAILAHLYNFFDRPTPQFIVVEPIGAPCLFESKKNNSIVRVKGDLPTIMAGLACGEPSHIGWNILKSAASAFLICSDEVARRGMKVLGNPLGQDQRIISGESGAVTLGALFEILSNNDYKTIKEEINLTSKSRVLLFSTEGDTDPDVYRNIVWK